MLGNAGKKLQKMVDLAEDLYERMNDLRDQLRHLQDTVDETHELARAIDAEQADHRALLEALADDQGIDVDRVLDGVDSED